MAQSFAIPQELFAYLPAGMDPARVKPIWSDSGLALPQGGPVTFERANQLWFLAGSGFRGSAGEAGVILSIDGTPIITSRLFFNTINTHQALVPSWVETSYGVGSHTVTISATGSLLTDSNDRWTVVLFELENTQQIINIANRPPVVTSLPSNPEDGQEVYYRVNDDDIWHLKYDSTISDAYKWRFVGGPPMRTFTAGVGESTGSGTYTTLASATSLTLPLKGIYDFWWHLEQFNNSTGFLQSTALQIINNGVGETLGGTTPGDYDAARTGVPAVAGAQNNGLPGIGSRRGTVTALPASARLVHRVTGGTGVFQLRHLHATPVRLAA